MSIDANKLVQFNMSLVNKNVLLIIATFNVNEGNIQNVVKVLGIHPRLIKVAKFQWQLINRKAKNCGHEGCERCG
jgi:hypothetical protein